MKKEMLDMLEARAYAKKNEALLTLKGFENHIAFIGDHSTNDLYDNMEAALTSLVDAEDRLDVIKTLRAGEYD